MVAAIVLILLLVLGIALWRARGEGAWTSPSGPDRQPLPPSRFRGRVVEPSLQTGPGSRQRSRLRNGSTVSAINNGRTVTRPDAIGLACLAPISKCTLGKDCLCVAEEDRGRRIG